MRASKITPILLLWSVGLCAIRAGEALSPPRSTPEEVFQSLVTAEGPSYFALRSNLFEYGHGAVDLLEAKRTSRDLHQRVLAAAVLSWIHEGPTNYLRTKLLGKLVRQGLFFRGDQLLSIQGVSDPVNGSMGGLTRLQDALHEDAAVPFLLEVALKGPTSVPDDPLSVDVAKKYSVAARCVAAGLVGGYKGPDTLPVLTELARSPLPQVRACAIKGLHRTKTTEGTEVIIAGLSDQDARVRATSHGALSDLTDQDLGDDQAEWLKWWQENKQKWPFNERVPGHKLEPQKWAPLLPEPLNSGKADK